MERQKGHLNRTWTRNATWTFEKEVSRTFERKFDSGSQSEANLVGGNFIRGGGGTLGGTDKSPTFRNWVRTLSSKE